MIEIYPNLYIGSADNYETDVKGLPDWFVVQACKDPYHRAALGYTGRAANSDHPEYLWARRDQRLILNLVDAKDPKFFSPQIMDVAVEFINEGLSAGKYVLVHCNQGQSRAPGIGLLYLLTRNAIVADTSDQLHENFRANFYPFYQPSGGVKGFIDANWSRYAGKFTADIVEPPV